MPLFVGLDHSAQQIAVDIGLISTDLHLSCYTNRQSMGHRAYYAPCVRASINPCTVIPALSGNPSHTQPDSRLHGNDGADPHRSCWTN